MRVPSVLSSLLFLHGMCWSEASLPVGPGGIDLLSHCLDSASAMAQPACSSLPALNPKAAAEEPDDQETDAVCDLFCETGVPSDDCPCTGDGDVTTTTVSPPTDKGDPGEDPCVTFCRDGDAGSLCICDGLPPAKFAAEAPAAAAPRVPSPENRWSRQEVRKMNLCRHLCKIGRAGTACDCPLYVRRP